MKEVVEKPDMAAFIDVEAKAEFQKLEEVVPLSTKLDSDIDPETLNLNVMDTPVIEIE